MTTSTEAIERRLNSIESENEVQAQLLESINHKLAYLVGADNKMNFQTQVQTPAPQTPTKEVFSDRMEISGYVLSKEAYRKGIPAGCTTLKIIIDDKTSERHKAFKRYHGMIK